MFIQRSVLDTTKVSMMRPTPPADGAPTRPARQRRLRSEPATSPQSGNEPVRGAGALDILDAAFWTGRSLYPVPEPPSGSYCVLQNDILCTFGGLQAECPSMLFQTVPRDVAVQPSTKSIYLRACAKRKIAPLPNVTEQLSCTPGRYMLLVLECSGTPLSADAVATLLPVMKANRDTLRVVNLRNCRLHDGAWEILSSFLVENGSTLSSLKSLELSCNNLDDEDASALPKIITRCRSLSRIGLLKNRFSRGAMVNITSALHDRARALSPAMCSPFEGSKGRVVHSSPGRRAVSPLHKSPQRDPRGVGTDARCADNNSVYLTLMPPPYQSSGDDARVPRITKSAFHRTLAMYRQFMTVQTALLDPHVLQQHQPAIFDVFRRQTSAMPVMEHITLPRYLCACFPDLHPQQVMYALGYYSEYSLTTVVRKVTHEGLRPDQKAEVMRIFERLDKGHTGVLPLGVLLPPRATPLEIEETQSMLKRLQITDIDFDAFAKICAPYLVETRRRRRLR